MVALDTSTIATDSSFAHRRRKRRRTNIIDQLQHINISNGEVGVPDQIVETNIDVDDNSQTLTSSDEEDKDDVTTGSRNNNNIVHNHHTNHCELLSDVEKAQHKIIRELVFGRPKSPPPANPVDRKLQALVRQSLQNVTKGEPPIPPANHISQSQDDMTIDPAYTKGNDRFSFDGYIPCQDCGQRQRSNSLPDDWGDGISDMELN